MTHAWRLSLFQKKDLVKGTRVNRYGWTLPDPTWLGSVGRELSIPFRCESWRCPDCRDFVRRRDFCRIEKGLQRHPARAVVFLVLTFDPRAFVDVWAAFDAMHPRLRIFMKWMKRNQGLTGYVATVEVHTGKRTPEMKGWPHLNIIAVAPELAAGLRRKDAWRSLEAVKGAAKRAGFGRVSAEIPKSVGAITSYCVKVAGDTEERVATMNATGEVTKTTDATGRCQLPLNAPPHFRRTRSSPGFLEPVISSGEWGGKAEFVPLPAAELAKWKEEQAAKARERTKSGAKRLKQKRSRYIARLRWFQLTFDLRAAEPAQLALPLAA